MNDLFSLSGKHFLITGGTRGIGKAISLRFARAGASVIANYVRDLKSAEGLKAEADHEGLSIELCRSDLTLPQGLQRLSQFLEESQTSQLSGLVHCAATGVHKNFSELTTRHFDWTFSLNVRAFFELIQCLLPKFSHGSTILAISSKGAVRSVPFYSIVGASKGALESLARHLSVELATQGIRVNILCPGSVLTDGWKVMPDSKKRIEETVRRTPIGRLVTTEEIAWAAQFLCSEAATGIVGHTLVVDGGVGIIE